MDQNGIEIGRLLRSGISGFVAGARVSELEAPSFGTLVRAPLGDNFHIFGLIYDINVDDDGLVRQLVTTDNVDTEVIEDNRVNRNVPMEMSVMSVGYQEGETIKHLLPPRAPLSLDVISQCTDEEVYNFTNAGRFGYFRHILRNTDQPISELLAAHLQQAHEVNVAAGKPDWANNASKELITLLRDDYSTLMAVLGALGDAISI
ncbi:MAG: hypothetical protein FVQ83_12045 [Chloroflexi bacterium]|nr:hypothetical protein [Chloroflexota bacterium]